MSEAELEFVNACWDVFAHDHQRPPFHAANGAPWLTWLLIGGRGAGKTRAGAEWVRAQALGLPPFAQKPVARIALVGETEHDVREVMIEGISGLLAVHRRNERPLWVPSRRRLEWHNGAVAYAFSAEDPESLRGPQFGCAWADELAKWRYAEAAFDMLQFGLRLGANPRQLVTTTPRPTALIKRLIAEPTTVVTRAPTRANAFHLAPTFLKTVMARYAGTRLGRQELDGELIEEVEGALWTRALIERCRAGPPLNPLPQAGGEALRRVVVGVDPPASAGGDACGIVVCGAAADGMLLVLDDRSACGLGPDGWARAVVAAAQDWGAERVIAETNQGGEMVAAMLRGVDAALPVRSVKARYGKAQRAEPVAALFEAGKAGFAGAFPELEDELCGLLRGGGYDGPGRSPDRADAMVWAMTELMPGTSGAPRVRGL